MVFTVRAGKIVHMQGFSSRREEERLARRLQSGGIPGRPRVLPSVSTGSAGSECALEVGKPKIICRVLRREAKHPSSDRRHLSWLIWETIPVSKGQLG
jgi:hypothetical protein